MNKDICTEILIGVILTLISLVLTAITFAVTYRLIMWIIGA